MSRLVQKFLPKQADIDKILKIIQQKVLKGTHLPTAIKDIQGYLVSSYFKDIYLYLAQNKLPGAKSAIRKIEAPVEKYILLRFIIIQNNIKSRKRDISTLNSIHNKVTFNKKSAITKENFAPKIPHSPIITSPLTKSHL